MRIDAGSKRDSRFEGVGSKNVRPFEEIFGWRDNPEPLVWMVDDKNIFAVGGRDFPSPA